MPVTDKCPPCTLSLPTTIFSSPSTNHFNLILSYNRCFYAAPTMVDVLRDPPLDNKPSLAHIHADLDTRPEPVVTSSPHESDSPFVDSDRRSITSYTSSVDREFVLRDVHGRVINNTSQVRPTLHVPRLSVAYTLDIATVLSHAWRVRREGLPIGTDTPTQPTPLSMVGSTSNTELSRSRRVVCTGQRIMFGAYWHLGLTVSSDPLFLISAPALVRVSYFRGRTTL